MSTLGRVLITAKSVSDSLAAMAYLREAGCELTVATTVWPVPAGVAAVVQLAVPFTRVARQRSVGPSEKATWPVAVPLCSGVTVAVYMAGDP